MAEDLRSKISAGEYGPGDRLPSERELVATYRVSRPTVRDAIGLLRSEGVVVAEHGRGVFVRPVESMVRLPRLSRAARELNRSAFMGDTAAAGAKPNVQVTIYFEPAGARAAELLGVEPGTELCVRDRVMSANDVVVQLAVSRFPRAVTAGTAIEQRNTGPGGVHSRLEEAGYRLAHYTETVGARMPTPAEASTLQLSPGVPVLTVVRIAFIADGTAVELNDMVLAAHRYELSYDIPAD